MLLFSAGFLVFSTSGKCLVLPLSLVQWFFDSVRAGLCLPEDGYVVTPPPPPAEPGSAVVYSQPWAVALNKFEPSVELSNTVLEGCKVGGMLQGGAVCVCHTGVSGLEGFKEESISSRGAR